MGPAAGILGTPCCWPVRKDVAYGCYFSRKKCHEIAGVKIEKKQLKYIS